MEPKVLGILLIAFSFCSVGFIQGANARHELRQMYDLVRILDYMTCELNFRLTPLPILCHSASEHGESLQKVFIDFADELDNQVSPEPSICMAAVLGKHYKLPHNIRKLLGELGDSFGKFDLQGQLNGICAVRTRCSDILQELETSKDVRIRTYQTFGLCAGAMVVILLL